MKNRLKEQLKLMWKAKVTYLLMGFAAILVLIPVLWMVSTSLKVEAETLSIPPKWIPDNITFDSYVRLWQEYPFMNYFLNSISVVVVSVIFTVIFSTLAGYGVTRFKFKGKTSFVSFLLITQMFPSVMLVIPYYKMLSDFNLSNSLFGLMLVYTSMTLAFCIWLMIRFFKTIPSSLDEAARIDGCSSFQIFYKVILPLTKPGIVTTCIYSFIQSWNDYMFAQTLLKDPKVKTVPLGIAELNGFYKIEWNDLMAASVIASIPVIILFFFLQKHFVSGLTAGSVK